MKSVEEKILALVNYADYKKGLYFDEDSIYAYDSYVDKDGQHFNYSVQSQSSYIEYEVEILKNRQGILGSCECPQFKKSGSCKHLAACYISYSNEIFANETIKSIQERSKHFLSELKKSFVPLSNETIKKELKIIVELKLDFNMWWKSNIGVELKAKIGEKKLYVLNSKFNDFYRAYKNEENYSFGAQFMYSPKLYYFSKETEYLLEFLDDFFDNSRYGEVTDAYLKRFLRFNSNEVLVEGEKNPIKIYNGFFFQAKLNKEEDKYILDFNCDFEQAFGLTNDAEYIYYDKGIYHLNVKERFLFFQLKENNLNKMVFTKKEFDDFKLCFLPYIKNYIEVDGSVDNLVVIKEPNSKLYFDLMSDKIIGKVIFNYGGYEIDYNKVTDNQDIFRDIDYEQKVINNLYNNHFILKDKQFLIEDLEDIVNFLDIGLLSLSKMYPVYTSENLKQTSIIKKPSVTSTFRLGIDKVLNYHMEVEGLESDEFANFWKSLKLKQKYFRLKNGDILDLTNENIESLYELEEELKIDEEDGTIPKFRALYLDSLKKQTKIIQTDESFEQFINQFNSYKNSSIEFSKEELSILRDYQKEGINWLYIIYKCGFGGILADEMGLGKSLQTIFFIKKILQKEDKFLIVCPTSLVYNWENEFKKFAPNLTYQVISGSKKQRKELYNSYKGNIYITSYGLLKEDLEYYEKLHFKVMIIDEAQAIKNPTTKLAKDVKKIKAEAKFALTGTPIENSVIELWSIFDYIMPGFLGVLGEFQNKYKLQEEALNDNEWLFNLKKQIKPFLLRRKKSDVAKDLPAKNENNIFIELKDEQKKIYAQEVKEAQEFMNKTLKNGNFQKNKIVILSLLTKLRQICLSPSLIYENYQDSSAKMEELLKVVEEVILNGHKILLFTSFQKAMDLIIKEFQKREISYYVINGSVSAKKRMELVEAFNKDDTNVFLIMLKSGGTGLNLTSADVVIHFDLWWNPQAENQATDRTHRIGQTKSVDVIRLICKNTIEERILELQIKKKRLSDKLIEDGTNESTLISSLTAEDIKELLKYENEG